MTLAALQTQIDYHQALYDDPDTEIEISDPEFDQLKVQLKTIAPSDHRRKRQLNPIFYLSLSHVMM